MGKINVLGFDVANLIAAGEVVDRPSSVVKELLENSIDAGADAITVEIQRGGVAFIRISDNGHGMEPDDLPVAILRHATSKIKNADDLAHISSLGFRGEALAAISSVSRLRIFSRTADSEYGAILTAEGGEVLDITETGCAKGTTVVVEDLFFNVPARRKFLKKDSTEAAAVGAVVERIALSRPDVSIKYICDGEVKFATAGDGKLYSAIYAVFGKQTASRTLEVNRASDGITVSGYVSEPDLIKSNRNMENFFVNGRYVKSKTAMAAVEQAYRSRIPQDKFPFCVINININPAAVDVNVHPAKLEIKFTNERLIFDAVYYAVINALESAVTRPELTLSRQRPIETIPVETRPGTTPTSRPTPAYTADKWTSPRAESTPEPQEKPQKRDSSFWIDGNEARRLLGAFVPADTRATRPEQIKLSLNVQNSERVNAPVAHNPVPAPRPAEQTRIFEEEPKVSETPVETKETASAGKSHEEKPTETPVTHTPTAEETVEETALAVPDYIILGEAYNCYVIVQLEDRLLFVDKHAAHERIIFDELCRKMKATTFGGQILIAPIEIELLEIEAEALEGHEEKFISLGYEYSVEAVRNKRLVKVAQIPEMLSVSEAEELFRSLVSGLSEVGAGLDAAADDFFKARLFQSACKAAIKGGRVYDMAHIKWICDRLFVVPEKDGGSVIRTCPHGRPVAFEVKKSSIDRQFARLT